MDRTDSPKNIDFQLGQIDATITRISLDIQCINEKLREIYQKQIDLATDIAGLKAKASIWGSIAGFISGLVIALFAKKF